MDGLLAGYRRFRSLVWPQEKARYEELAESTQAPRTLVVACSDSRVDPQTIFGAAPGQIFVVRNVGGLVPPFDPTAGYHGTSAALEYGVRVLGVKNVIVLGHGRCGGVRAMVEGVPAEANQFVGKWIEIARPDLLSGNLARLEGEALLAHCEREVVRLSLRNLATYSWIGERVASGLLTLAGFHFDIQTGRLERLGAGGFVAIE